MNYYYPPQSYPMPYVGSQFQRSYPTQAGEPPCIWNPLASAPVQVSQPFIQRPMNEGVGTGPIRSTGFSSDVLRDRTNQQWHEQGIRMNSNGNKGGIASTSDRNIQQMYSQYKAGDVYEQNISQTHSQLQLSQLLHRREKNNRECDAHTK